MSIFYTLGYHISQYYEEIKWRKHTTPFEQFLIPIGNNVETEAITIPITAKYMSSHIDHLNEQWRN
jgi:hypothetical protein